MEDEFFPGQEVHYVNPPGGGQPIRGRVVAVGPRAITVDLPQGVHELPVGWLRPAEPLVAR